MPPVLSNPNFSSIIFAVTIILNVVIAAFVYANNPKHATNKLFLALSISISIWLGVMLAASMPALHRWNLVIARLTLVFATPMNVLFFLFAKTVPDNAIGISKKKLAFLFAAAGIVAALAASPLTFSGLSMFEGKPEPIPGPGLPVFGLFSIALNIAAVVVLFLRTRHTTSRRRLQLHLVLLGILLMFGLIFGTIFIPVFLLGDTSFIAFAPLYVLIFTGFTGYAIFKRKMLNVKLVAAEVFSAMLLFINTLQLFFSGSALDFAMRFAAFLVVCFVVIMFIRSIGAEELQHEEMRSLTSQLAEANTQLEALDEAKSEFISIASHQLRTPASVLKGYLSLMLEGAYGQVPPTIKEKLDQMYSMNERLIHLINNILNMSRIEKNRLEFICSYVDVVSVIDEVVMELGSKAREKKLELRFAKPASELPRAYVDGDKLHEIVVNLVENAIKYTIKGTVQAGVDVRRGQEGDEVVFTVTDSGVGMSEEDAARMFEKFYRAKSAAGVPRESGTGLGLYICAKFLDNMGGRIWIERTTPGKGTTFAVALPTKPQQRCARGT